MRLTALFYYFKHGDGGAALVCHIPRGLSRPRVTHACVLSSSRRDERDAAWDGHKYENVTAARRHFVFVSPFVAVGLLLLGAALLVMLLIYASFFFMPAIVRPGNIRALPVEGARRVLVSGILITLCRKLCSLGRRGQSPRRIQSNYIIKREIYKIKIK